MISKIVETQRKYHLITAINRYDLSLPLHEGIAGIYIDCVLRQNAAFFVTLSDNNTSRTSQDANSGPIRGQN